MIKIGQIRALEIPNISVPFWYMIFYWHILAPIPNQQASVSIPNVSKYVVIYDAWNDGMVIQLSTI